MNGKFNIVGKGETAFSVTHKEDVGGEYSFNR